MKTTAIQNEMLSRYRDILSELLQPIEKRLTQLETTVASQAKKAADCRCPPDHTEKITLLESTVKELKGNMDTMQIQVGSILKDSRGLRSFTDELSAMRTELQAVSKSSLAIEEFLKQPRPKSKKS